MVSETLDKITPAAFANIQAEISKEVGSTISGETGTYSSNGFTFDWKYDPAAQTLTLINTKKPFLVPDFAISEKMKELAKIK